MLDKFMDWAASSPTNEMIFGILAVACAAMLWGVVVFLEKEEDTYGWN